MPDDTFAIAIVGSRDDIGSSLSPHRFLRRRTRPVPLSTFARLGASGLALALGLLAAAPAPAEAAPSPGRSAAGPRGAESRAVAKPGRIAKPDRVAKPGRIAKPGKVTKTAKAGRGDAAATPDATGALGRDEAEAGQAPGVTWTSAEPEELRCGRSRRKLWQAGEGWVVKTVTVCR